MAITDPVNTMRYHMSRPLVAVRDMSAMPLPAVAAAAKHFMETNGNNGTKPEIEALWFYGMNHGMALLQQAYAPLEPMTDEDRKFVSQYFNTMNTMAIRAFYYLLMICTKEARHSHSIGSDLPIIKEKFGEAIATFFVDNNEDEQIIHKALLNAAPDVSLGAFVNATQWQFYHSAWGSGFGGVKWGNVNDCLCRFVHGEITGEMMLDTNWTLAHNGGPIFNKGMLYGHYTGTLHRILDIQRSGQIPEAIIHDGQTSKFVPASLLNRMQWLRERFPDAIGNYVDWFVVEALGAVHQYPNDKQAQLATHGQSAKASAAQKQQAANEAAASAKAKAAAEKAAADHAEKMKNKIEIMPNVYVEKYQRAA